MNNLFNGIMDRMLRAAKLDKNLYEEVEADSSLLGQAMVVVILSSIAGGIGASGDNGLIGLLRGTVSSLAGWFVWAYIVYFVGTRLLPEPTTSSSHGELLRTIGFSSSPGLIMVFGIIPGLGGILYTVATVWMLISMIIAVRQALDYSNTPRAIFVCIIGVIANIAVMVVLRMIMRIFNIV